MGDSREEALRHFHESLQSGLRILESAQKGDKGNELKRLEEAIEHLHGTKGTFQEREEITEMFRSNVVWSRDVFTFRLEDHSEADTCYAWKETDPETGKDRFFAVLKAGPVQSARDAVRASLMKDYRDEQK